MFGPQDFGNGPLSPGGQSDVFATVYDVNDAIVFARSFGNDAFEQANGIALDGLGGVVVVGEFVNGIDFGGGPLTSGDSFIVRLDASGNHVWSKAVVPGIESRAFAVAIDSAGAVYVTGELTGGADFGGGFLPGAGNRDVFVVKLDASGSHQWSHLYGDGDHQSGMSITVDGTGNAYVAGYFNGAIGFGGPTLSNPPNPGGTDGFLVKLDTGGGHVWTKHFGASGNQAAIAVSSDASGNVAVTGAQEGSVDYGGGPLSASASDVFVVRYQPNGTHAWSTIFGDAAEQVGRGIAMDGSSSVIVVGDFFGMIDFGGSTLASAGDRDVFLAKLSSTGQHAWSHGFGDPAIQQGLAVAAEGGGRIALAGHFSGVIQFGGSTLTANTVAGFVARFAP
jgi:hypothetical protein